MIFVLCGEKFSGNFYMWKNFNVHFCRCIFPFDHTYSVFTCQHVFVSHLIIFLITCKSNIIPFVWFFHHILILSSGLMITCVFLTICMRVFVIKFWSPVCDGFFSHVFLPIFFGNSEFWSPACEGDIVSFLHHHIFARLQLSMIFTLPLSSLSLSPPPPSTSS